MIRVDANIFIEMKAHDAVPGNVAAANQGAERIQLRGAGGENNADSGAFLAQIAKSGCGSAGSGLASGRAVRVYFHIQRVNLK